MLFRLFAVFGYIVAGNMSVASIEQNIASNMFHKINCIFLFLFFDENFCHSINYEWKFADQYLTYFSINLFIHIQYKCAGCAMECPIQFEKRFRFEMGEKEREEKNGIIEFTKCQYVCA